DADQVTQQRCGFFAERVPVEVGTRGLHPEHESDGQKGGRRRQLPHRSSISTYPWLAGARTTRLFVGHPAQNRVSHGFAGRGFINTAKNTDFCDMVHVRGCTEASFPGEVDSYFTQR